MSLVGNVSSQVVGNNFANISKKLFHPSSSGSTIALFAVAVIITLGLVLLKRFCPGLQFFATASTSPSSIVQSQEGGGLGLTTSPESSASSPLPKTATIPITKISLDPADVPDNIFTLGESRGATHYEQSIGWDGTQIGWLIVYDYKDKSDFISTRMGLPSSRIETSSLDQADWIKADEVRKCKRPNINFVTDPSHVSDYAFQLTLSPDFQGTTHYRELQDAHGNRLGWLLINDNDKTAYKVPFNSYFPDKRSVPIRWAFPTDQAGWMSAEEVRRCKQQTNPQLLQLGTPQQEGSSELSSSSEDDFSSTTEPEESDASTDGIETEDEQLQSDMEEEQEQPIEDSIKTPDLHADQASEASDHSTDATGTGDEQHDSTLTLPSSSGANSEGVGGGGAPESSLHPESTILTSSNSSESLPVSTIGGDEANTPTSTSTSKTQISRGPARARPKSSLAHLRQPNAADQKFRGSKFDTLGRWKAIQEQKAADASPTSHESSSPEAVPAPQPIRSSVSLGGPQRVNLFGAGGAAGALAGLRKTNNNKT